MTNTANAKFMNNQTLNDDEILNLLIDRPMLSKSISFPSHKITKEMLMSCIDNNLIESVINLDASLFTQELADYAVSKNERAVLFLNENLGKKHSELRKIIAQRDFEEDGF